MRPSLSGETHPTSRCAQESPTPSHSNSPLVASWLAPPATYRASPLLRTPKSCLCFFRAAHIKVTPYSCEEAGPGCPALPPESGCALAAPAFSRPGSLHSRLRRRRRRRRLGSIGQTAGGATRLAAGEVTVRDTGDKIGPLDRSPPAQGTRRRQLKQERQFFQSCLTQAYAAARCLNAVRAAEVRGATFHRTTAIGSATLPAISLGGGFF